MMNWSKLSQPTKRLVLAIAVFVVFMGIIMWAVNRSKPNVGANNGAGTGDLTLDSGFGENTSIQIKSTDLSDVPKSAFIDAFSGTTTTDGVVSETDANGIGRMSLSPDECYTLRATDKNSNAQGNVIVATGSLDPTTCGAGAIAASAGVITIKMQ